MTGAVVRLSRFQAGQGDFLVLNNLHAVETSFLGPEAWERMLDEARFALCVEPAAAFLLAFDQDGRYDSPNFVWFKDRYERFVYIDRVIVSAAAQGRGLGKALYEYLFAEARAAGFDVVVCEVNIAPPNPGSVAFHEKLGFVAVGEQAFVNGKVVRYFERKL